jgi:ubiquinone/menaquinone biosynthesis C-methylase UbiE
MRSSAASRENPVLEELLGRLIDRYRAAKAVFVAAELDVFRALDRTDGGAAAVARRVKASPRGVEVLLDALCALGFIVKRGSRYRLTPFARARLHPDGERSLANNLRYQELLSPAYADLTDTIRSGRPRQGLRQLLSRRPDFVRDYIRGMADIAKRPAAELAQALDLSECRRLLDVGGGPGTFSLACLAREPRLSAVILDLPETLKITRGLLRAAVPGGRVELRAGDYHRAPFGDASFDLVLLSHVTHDEGPERNRALLRKAHAALKKGGQVVVHDFMTVADRTGPLFPALFSLHLLAYTDQGRTYSEEEYRTWLAAAGFESARRVDICPHAPNATAALIARKT